MAVKISQLPAATDITGEELVPVVQDGETRHAAASLLGGTRAVTLSLTAPPEVASGDNWIIDAAAVSRHSGGSIAAFEVEWWDGISETATATSGAATLSKVVNEVDGTTITASVRALDDIGNASKPETATATATSANNPPAGPITIGAPTQVGRGGAFQVSFSGATDPDGDPITYTVTDPGAFAFAKSTGITEGESVDVTAPDVASETDVTFSVVAEDDGGAQSATYSKTVTVTASQVIGVEMTATGGPGGTWNHIDEAGAAIATPTTSWFNGHPVFGGMQDVVIDGQDMVEIPKFYYKRGTSAAGNPAWWISDQLLNGYAIHPAFVLNGVEVAAFQVGKYQASEVSGKMESKPGVLPWGDMTLFAAISNAEARNVGGVTGFRLWHHKMWSAIQWLYLVEIASMDTKTATATGRTSAGSTANVDAADVIAAGYRGVLGLWGNINQWLDGARVMSGFIETRDYDPASTWASTGIPETGIAFAVTIEPTTPSIFLPGTVTNNEADKTCPEDMYWASPDDSRPFVGGGNSDEDAGLFSVQCTFNGTLDSTTIGARLSRISA